MEFATGTTKYKFSIYRMIDKLVGGFIHGPMIMESLMMGDFPDDISESDDSSSTYMYDWCVLYYTALNFCLFLLFLLFVYYYIMHYTCIVMYCLQTY